MHFPFSDPCPESRPRRPGIYATLVDTPWLEAGTDVWFCSEECEEQSIRSGSFDYVWCEPCGRRVCEQNPTNGWHVQFRRHGDDYICLRCYEGRILEHGQPRDDFDGETISGGMFFSHGNPEPSKAGFEEVDGFSNYFVSDRRVARLYNLQARRLIDSGHAVVTGYERLSILGDEGYVTMFAREAREGENE